LDESDKLELELGSSLALHLFLPFLFFSFLFLINSCGSPFLILLWIPGVTGFSTFCWAA
jgi:hypothetical protein